MNSGDRVRELLAQVEELEAENARLRGEVRTLAEHAVLVLQQGYGG